MKLISKVVAMIFVVILILSSVEGTQGIRRVYASPDGETGQNVLENSITIDEDSYD